MNDLQQNKPTLQIVAVVFCGFHAPTMQLRMQEKPYFYLDTIGLNKGDYALVHNGSEFAVVKVVRVFEQDESVAVQYVSKPILAPIKYDPELVKGAAEKLTRFKEQTVELRIENEINKQLGMQEIFEAKRKKRYDFNRGFVENEEVTDIEDDEAPL